MSSQFDFDAAVAASDAIVFLHFGKPATVTPPAGGAPLPAPVTVIVDEDYRVQGEEGHFANTYGGRMPGITFDAHFLEFQKRELSAPQRGMIFELEDGSRYKLDELAGKDEFTFIYAALKL